jgi:energy-coupling factor transport system ATP-binding protein
LSIIECKDVQYAYRDEAPALDGVTLAVEQGEFVAIIGHNGSGKSTLAKHINALFKPQRGTVLTVGLDTSDPRNSFIIRSHAGMVFQNPDTQMVTSVVADDVAFGPENLAVAHEQIVTRVQEALGAVGMTDFASRNPAHLSGGQKQRICIAGVLAMRPDILVLDEPGAMLDARGRRGIRRIVRELNKGGMTVVLITHFMEEAVLAQRVLVMAQGSVVMSGTPQEVFCQRERLRALKMEVPFSILLAEALQKHGIGVSSIIRPEDLKEELCRLVRAEQGGVRSLVGARPLENVRSLVGAEQDGVRAGTEQRDGTRVPEAGAGTEQAPHPAAACPSVPQLFTKSPPPLVLEQLSYTYSSHEGQTVALRDLSLRVEDGAYLGIIGHTGSGKSTLLQLMCGLLQPSFGRVLINGEDLADKTVRRSVHAKVGMAFQYPEHQLFAPTVAEDIAFGPKNAKLPAEQIDQRVRQAMQRMGLDFEKYAAKSPFELSGGEKRRVALAGVIACDPKILILDEPTAGLDPAGRDELLGYVEQFHRAGMTIIMVSHSMDDIARYATQILVLNQGESFMQGSPQEVFCHGEELRAINLGVPQATSFAAELNALGFSLPGDLYSVDALALAIAQELGGDRCGL